MNIETLQFETDQDTHRTVSFLRSLGKIENKKEKSAVDLGAGHCKFSIIASLYFGKVDAVDARDVRVPKELPSNVSFIKKDATNFDVSEYNVVFCLGLLYHMTAKEQGELLKKCLGKQVIIDTHMSLVKKDYSGSYWGINYDEANDRQSMMKNPKASFTTLESFWFHEDDFIKMIKKIGFKKITKFLPEHYPGRTFMIIE